MDCRAIVYLAAVYLFTYSTGWSIPTAPDFQDLDSDPISEDLKPRLNEEENDSKFWYDISADTLKEKINRKLRTNVAKNVIFFIGDGLSVQTIAAARIYQGQLKNRSGEEEKLSFEKFPYTGLSKTYCTDKQVADSACSATAYMAGVKANYRTIGVNAKVNVGDCEAAKRSENRPSSLLSWMQKAGKATGVITTTRITHASPAGTYAHVPFRDMECDNDVRKMKMDESICNFDIAKQLITEEPGKNVKVIMGGGKSKFFSNGDKNAVGGNTGARLDGLNLVETWKDEKESRRNATAKYVSNKEDLHNLDVSKTDYLLGLFADSHMNYHLEAPNTQPSLEEMTKVSIEMLKKDKNGFFLFVEGGRIDHAHHENEAKLALDETVEFAKAIQAAADMTSEEDTLIVVTADHGHVMTISGYPARGNNILKYYGTGQDNMTYLTLSYANGPGYEEKRRDLSRDDFDDNPRYKYPATVPKEVESHGGEDVVVYARGPWAHLFSGNYEQSFIPYAEAYAARVGPSTTSSAFHMTSSYSLLLLLSITLVFVNRLYF